MKRTVIFGSGQGGYMALQLLSSEHKVVVFCDNKTVLHGTYIYGIPVQSPASINWEQIDCTIISVFNKEAISAIKKQIIELGFDGETIVLIDLRNTYDIRLATIRLLSNEIKEKNIDGDIAELGVYKGDTAIELNRLFPNRTLHLFDTFSGFDQKDIDAENGRSRAKSGDFSDTSVEYVLSRMPYSEMVKTYVGRFPSILPEGNVTFALVSLDTDLYLPTLEGLEWFYPRLSRGGVIVVHDYNSTQFCGVNNAVSEFCTKYDVFPIPLCDLHGSCIIQKQ